MLTKIEDLPENIIGFTINGALGVDDYQSVLLPALEAQNEKGAIELLLVTAENFLGTDVGAAIGGQQFRRDEPLKFKNIALVSDNKGFAQAVYMFGMLAHAEVKVFDSGKEGLAIAWLEQ